MAHLFRKYEFESLEKAEQRIDALPSATDEEGNTYPAHSHSIVKLGYLVQVPATFDEEGNELTPAVLSDKYSVDVLWNADELPKDEEGNVDYPYGWVSKEVEYNESWSSKNGAHTFFGWSFS
jgi:FlaG/FlaF family flagellin (archaellin)